MNPRVEIFSKEIQAELYNILTYWKQHSPDTENGGFLGKIDNNGKVHTEAPKGGVLNTRILWTFSSAYNHLKDEESLLLADRAYVYLREHFRDPENDGLFWSVDYNGKPLSKRKQIYGQAFGIYGLSEYFIATGKEEALSFAKELFYLIEKHSFDAEKGGYFEAFSENWVLIDDLRLSEKDRNDPKTMNTHLHILEAYANLYKVWKDEDLKKQIRHLLAEVFQDKIIHPETRHLQLFFDKDWHTQSEAISYGHDIEAAWLLQEAAEILNEEEIIAVFRKLAVEIADASTEGIGEDGAFNHEFDPSDNHLDSHREWWVSAEGMVGFLNAFQLTGNPEYFEKVIKIWGFTKENLLDKDQGEWFWGRFKDGTLMNNEDKIGFWKCPYHNARACMEIMHRLGKC